MSAHISVATISFTLITSLSNAPNVRNKYVETKKIPGRIWEGQVNLKQRNAAIVAAGKVECIESGVHFRIRRDAAMDYVA